MKKLISIVITFVVTAVLVSVAASPEAWAVDATNSIPISSREELVAIANNLSGSYHLVSDIDMSYGAWKPILYFAGTFDGCGHVISNLTIRGEGENGHAGLFGSTTSSAVIKNIGLKDTDIVITTGSPYVGGLCGTNGGLISNSYNTGSVAVAEAGFFVYVGGICGYNNGTVEYCYNTGSVSASRTECGARYTMNTGGISGYNEDTVSSCYNTGSVTSSVEKTGSYCTEWVGGICGISVDNAIVKNSYWDVDSVQSVYGKVLSNADKKGLGDGIGQTTSLTNEQIMQQSSFIGWDFDRIWTYRSNLNNGYPVLRAFFESPSSWADENVNRAIALGIIQQSMQSKYTQATTRAEFCSLAVALYEKITGSEISDRCIFRVDKPLCTGK